MTVGNIEHFDAIVIGAGQAGGPLAGDFARAGKKTAIVEREYAGGTCINVGCTPTKTMIASGRVAYLARRASDYGVDVGPVAVDMKTVRERKRNIAESFRGGSERRLTGVENLDLIWGEARFTGPKELEIALRDGGTRRLSAPLIFINTGGRPAVPSVEGLGTVPYFDSTSIMELDEVPEHLLVIGGGYIGMEFTQLFRRLGSKVTVIQHSAKLLPHEDDDVIEEMVKVIREDGATLLFETEALSVSGQAGAITLSVRDKEHAYNLQGSHLLTAAGRTPNTDKLNTEAAGLKLDAKGYIPVNERLETNVEGIYALGDVNGGPAFTHISYDDYRIVRDNLLKGGSRTTHDRQFPYVVFTDPQLGRIGLSENDAREKGHKIRVAKMPMNYIARALEVDEPRGFMKAVVDAENGQILGAAVFGLEGGEIMAMLEIAMIGKVPYTVLKDAVFAHPTLAESLNNLFGSFEDEK